MPLLVDGVFLLGGLSVDVITWVVSVGPFTVQEYMQSTSNFTSIYVHTHTHTTCFYFEFDPTLADNMHLLCLCITLHTLNIV